KISRPGVCRCGGHACPGVGAEGMMNLVRERPCAEPGTSRALAPHERRLTTMKTKAPVPAEGAARWQRGLHFEDRRSPPAARALLKVGFSEADHGRMAELSAKARAGTLTAAEQTDLDTFERLGCLLDILHSQARVALKKKPRHAS